MWSALHSVSPLPGKFQDSILFLWIPSDIPHESQTLPEQFISQDQDLSLPIPCKELAQDLASARGRSAQWQDVHFIQFLGLSDDEASMAIHQNATVESLVGAGHPRAPGNVPRPTQVPPEPPATPRSLASTLGSVFGTPASTPSSAWQTPRSRSSSQDCGVPWSGAPPPPPPPPTQARTRPLLPWMMPQSPPSAPSTPIVAPLMDYDDVAMELRRALRASVTPDSVRSRSTRRGAPSPPPGLPQPSRTPDSVRSRSSRRVNPGGSPASRESDPSQSLPPTPGTTIDYRSEASTIDYGPRKDPQSSTGTKRTASVASPGSVRDHKPARTEDPTHTGGMELPFQDSDSDDDSSIEEAWLAWQAELNDGSFIGLDNDLLTSAHRSDMMAQSGEPHDIPQALTYLESLEAAVLEEYQIGIEGSMALCHESLGSAILEGDTLVYTVSDDGSLSQATIVRDARPLTKEEIQQHKGGVSAGKIQEIRGGHTLGCFRKNVQTHIQVPS